MRGLLRTHRSHSFALLIRLEWVRRSIRPPARGNHEDVDWFRIAMELWIQHDGSSWHIRAPSGTVDEWCVKHQVTDPVVVGAIVKVLFFRHHVGHGSRLQGWHPLLYECLHTFEDLSFGLTGQYHLRSFICNWQDGADGQRVVADRPSKFRVPKAVGKITLEWAHPPSLHSAYDTILAFDCAFIAVPSQNQDFGIARDGPGRRAPRHGNLGVAIH